MSTPRVSICLPNLNTLPYLAERIETIEAQSFGDWELLVYDSNSTDGAWEYFCELAIKEPRMRIWQGPREGTPGSWTPCIREARGEFVYIATSDDTMAHDCLEKMVQALDENPDCELAHCSIRIIDENGELGLDWWSGNSLFAKSSGDLAGRRHKRIAPLDGILCLLGDNVYTSATQLLIRRSLFEKIGYYQKDWGAVGDFHWNLRAGLAASTVHVPETWGGWRIHQAQATAGVELGSSGHRAKIDDMIEDVLEHSGRYVDAGYRGANFDRLETRARELRSYLREHARQATAVDRRIFVIRQALSGNRLAWQHLVSMLPGRTRWPRGAPEAVRSWFEDEMLILLP